MNLDIFNQYPFLEASRKFFDEKLNIPLHAYTDESLKVKDALPEKYKDREPFTLIKDIYVTGMVDDAAFADKEGARHDELTEDYEGILIFAISLSQRDNNLLPTRSQLAEISRAFNQEFKFVPVVVLFKYHLNDVQYLAFANTERLTYKQQWREGEKAGKVSILRDIDINNTHRGHIELLKQLVIPTTGKDKVGTFDELYKYWQKTFDVSLLNKKFYKELANWYFWAVKHVKFPSEPTLEDAEKAKKDYNSMVQEHNAKNVIRLLTRLLFSWFIKEKGLIPEELFDLEALQKDILNEINPYHEEKGLFQQANHESIYYKAILQNLFFASLNCPIEPDGEDKRKRGFRGDGYGTHRGIDYLMRYKKYFKNPDAFMKLMNETVPFLNGGLFECLDDKFNHVYVDGFSDQMTKGEKLVVPDYLFFGYEEKIDLSDEYGIKSKGTKQAAVKGLINLLNSYKFTITENTPIEEDVALDPELLGKVFENLLASYNPETKTTARKQTGSFYTPREIVNYMVDESLIAYLKNAVEWEEDNEKVDEKLHQLSSFDDFNPFEDDSDKQKELVFAIDRCKILDPACGSGAFPMGALQKMVHMLQKLDPENKIWKEAQRRKVMEETEEAFDIEDKKEREQKLIEINNAFDERINNPDYARKLYLIENSIYGVDIQPIATQISKLRFFISLVVDQKSNDKPEENFNIQPLPNLETRFVAANTLIGIEKPDNQGSLFDTKEIHKLENELKKIRHKLFSARTKETKLKYREKDEELRHLIAQTLKENGWPYETAEKLATWDPYDQNASSSFFDPEWMFDIKRGFNMVIGNPPYLGISKLKDKDLYSKLGFKTYDKSGDIYCLFYEKSNEILANEGVLCLITSNQWLQTNYGKLLTKYFSDNLNPLILINFGGYKIFESATVDTSIMISLNQHFTDTFYAAHFKNDFSSKLTIREYFDENKIKIDSLREDKWIISENNNRLIKEEIRDSTVLLKHLNISILRGLLTGLNKAFIITSNLKDELIRKNPKNSQIIKPILRGRDVHKYAINWAGLYLIVTKNEIDINNYPEILKHLESFGDKIKERSDQGKNWWNLRACNYYDVFKEPKIIYPETSVRRSEFFIDKDGFYIDKTCFMIVGEKLKYLQAILSSSLMEWYLESELRLLGKKSIQYSKQFIGEIPIAITKEKYEITISFLVDIIIQSKKSFKSHFQLLETISGAIVFEIYFENHMKERKIEVLDLVMEDIKAVWSRYPELNYEDEEAFEMLPDAQKDEIIDALHQKWTDPENEVVKRMAQFKEKSPDILKVIMESGE